MDFEGGGHSDIRSSPWPGALSPPEEAKADRPLTTQFLFARPELMQIHWQLGDGGFDSDPIIAPARRNFPEGAVCRLKLSNIPGREGVEFYPTLEVGVSTPQTFAYVARNAVKVDFSAEDFDHMLSGKFATKVIYLPDPEFSEPALADVETLVSTRLDPGVDPVLEADRRGAVLAIIRWGDNDITRSKVCTAD